MRIALEIRRYESSLLMQDSCCETWREVCLSLPRSKTINAQRVSWLAKYCVSCNPVGPTVRAELIANRTFYARYY
jgi:hypothetical protein